VHTCSLTCSKRHKLWASCNGIRDPTVFKPISQVATPAGIDHDYNFLHSIETGVQRSEKRLIEDLGIISKDELSRARTGQNEPGWTRKNKVKTELPGDVCIVRELEQMQTRVLTAPKGMRRNKENTTSWQRKYRTINWQVEWIREGGHGRTLYKAWATKPIGESYDALLEEERRMGMTDEEKRVEKKRKSGEQKARLAKKARLENRDASYLSTGPLLQDDETGAWNYTPEYFLIAEPEFLESPEPEPPTRKRNYHLYLHRPLTPSSYPKVLVPLDPDQPLKEILREREVLEFPTIYVLENEPADLPGTFMLEIAYLRAIGKAPSGDEDTSMGGTSDTSDTSDEDSSSSSEDEDSMEEGEIA